MRTPVWNQRGFSLAELLVVTAVLGLTMSAVFLIQQKGQESYTMGSNRIEAQQNTRVALDLMTRELRTALQMVTLGGPGDVTFLDQSGVQVQYQLASGTLNRISGGTMPIIGGVQALTMTYCKVWNAVTNTCATTAATPAEVTVIQVRLTAKTEESVAAGSLGDRRAVMETAIRLRNIN